MAGYLRQLCAELFGSFLWVTLGAGAVCADAVLQGRLGPSGVALAQGLAVASVFGLFGRQAAGLCNPALTLALAAWRRMDWVKAALCILCQLLGATFAGMFLAQLFGDYGRLGAMSPSLGFRSATLLEAVLTFFLAVIAHKFLQERRGEGGGALTAGALAAAAALMTAGFGGAALNPARAFGPAMIASVWHEHYVYWIGPLAGALAGIKSAELLSRR